MVSTSMRISTVVPATMTGDQNKVHELTNMDLAMKLHYIKGVYFFNSEAVEGLTIYDLKEPMFQLLQLYFTASGRIRRQPETGRPFIRCNDGGVRIVEAYCEESVDEWLAMAMEDSSLFDGLSYGQPLGPDLGFSPLVFLQFTWFKCGGMSLGLSWANVLGDAFSASAFMNMWGKIMAGPVTLKSFHVPDREKSHLSIPMKPCNNSCLKMVDSVGDYWLAPNSHKMRTHTFHVSAQKLDHLLSNQPSKFSGFEILSSIIWKALSKIKENSKETRMVTICTRNSHDIMEFEFPSNGMVFNAVEADFVVAEADVAELAKLIWNTRAEEDGGEVAAGREEEGEGEENLDFIAYGARLTFVNLEEVEIYGLELKGQKPVYANYSINGVGDEGVVLVLPGPKGDRLVTAVLPENELARLRNELESDWSTIA